MRFSGNEQNEKDRLSVENTYTLYKSMLLYNPKWAAESILMRFRVCCGDRKCSTLWDHSRCRAAYEIATRSSVGLTIMFKSIYIISFFGIYFCLVCGQPVERKSKFNLFNKFEPFFCDFNLLGELCARLTSTPFHRHQHFPLNERTNEIQATNSQKLQQQREEKNYSPNSLLLMRSCHSHTRRLEQNENLPIAYACTSGWYFYVESVALFQR